MEATTLRAAGAPSVYSAPAKLSIEGGRVVRSDVDADRAITDVYTSHYTSFVRLATLLLRDQAVAEEVVQDAFVELHKRWRKLRDSQAAVAYVRTAVVHKARSVGRRRTVAAKHPEDRPLDVPSAEHGALQSVAGEAVVSALRTLPVKQREVLVLRYYADLSEGDIAETMGISRGAVKSHASRGMTALRSRLEEWS